MSIWIYSGLDRIFFPRRKVSQRKILASVPLGATESFELYFCTEWRTYMIQPVVTLWQGHCEKCCVTPICFNSHIMILLIRPAPIAKVTFPFKLQYVIRHRHIVIHMTIYITRGGR